MRYKIEFKMFYLYLIFNIMSDFNIKFYLFYKYKYNIGVHKYKTYVIYLKIIIDTILYLKRTLQIIKLWISLAVTLDM